MDLLCVANSEGYFIDVNPAFTKVLGYSKEELLSKPFVDFVHPEDIEKTFKETAKLLEGSDSIVFENRYLHKDGTYRVLSWNCKAPETDEHMYSVARDITELRHTERELIQIHKALTTHAIIAITDSKGVITKVNDKFLEISGYSEEELIGKTHKVVNSGMHSPEFFKDMWEKISSGQAWSGLIENRHKEGHHYFVYSIITPIFDIQREIESYISIRIDMTEYVNLKDAFEKTNNILNETGQIAKVGGWELEVETGELNWTDETFKILEVEKKEGQKPMLPEGLELFTEGSKPIIDKAVFDCMTEGISYSLEVEAQTAKGNVLWVYTNGKANYVDGKIKTISGTIQDIDIRKKAQLTLEKERVISMHNSKLASLGEMSAGIAHEINNPLTVIAGTIGLLKRYKDDSEKFEKKLEAMSKSATRIEKIVKSLKKFSRSNESTEKTHCDLNQIIHEAIGLMDFKTKKYDIEIDLDINIEGEIYCDEVEIEQVLVNLLSNALDSISESDEKWVRLKAYQEENKAIIKVSDSGPAVPIEIREKIFEPFYTTKGIGEGTGLGLSISKGIIEDHEGKLKLYHEERKSCFVVELPLV